MAGSPHYTGQLPCACVRKQTSRCLTEQPGSQQVSALISDCSLPRQGLGQPPCGPSGGCTSQSICACVSEWVDVSVCTPYPFPPNPPSLPPWPVTHKSPLPGAPPHILGLFTHQQHLVHPAVHVLPSRTTWPLPRCPQHHHQESGASWLTAASQRPGQSWECGGTFQLLK